MWTFIRNNAGNAITGIGLGVIVIVFIFFFGPQSSGFGPGSREWAVRVDGLDDSSVAIFDNEILAAAERMRVLTRNNTRLEEEAFAQLRRDLAVNLGLTHYLAAEAQDFGLAVTDDEVQCFIVNWHRGYSRNGERICADFPEDYADRYPNYDMAFYGDEDGRILNNMSNRVRNNFATSMSNYERYKRSQLLALKYLDVLAESFAPSAEEVASVWRRRNETVELEFIALDPTALQSAEVADEAVQAALAGDLSEIEAYYTANPDTFTSERNLELQRIFLRKPEPGTDAYTEAETNYQSLLERAQGAEDFDALAREFTELDSERENAGDMGVRNESNLSNSIWEATTASSTGDVVGVEQLTSWNIIRVRGVTEAGLQPFAEVQEQAARAMLEERALAATRENLIARGQRVLELAAGAESLEAAATAEATPEAVEGEEAPTATNALTVGNTGAFAREQVGQSLADLGPQYAGVTLPPPPADSVPNIGTSRELVQIAFGLTEEAPLHPEFVEVEGVNYIVRLVEHAMPADEIPADELAALSNTLRAEVSDALFGPRASRLNYFLVPFAQGSRGPVLQDMLNEAVTSGKIQLNASLFGSATLEEVTE